MTDDISGWYFYPGQKVVCIDDKPPSGQVWFTGLDDVPVVGQIYTVVTVKPIDNHGMCLELAELRRCEEALKQFGGIHAYRACRFRPVTSIKSLESLLKKKPDSALVREVQNEIANEKILERMK